MTYDAALHLLDRQIVDSDGRLVAKVDDVELTWREDGTISPTGLLVGLPALLPRLGGWWGDRLMRLVVEIRWMAAERGRPLVIDFDLVDGLTSEVRLSCSAEGLLRRLSEDRDDATHRLGDLLGLPVRCAALPARSKVLDARISGRPGERGEHRLAALVVGPGRPGGLLGYDRRGEPGPAVVAAVVRWLHRHARAVDLDAAVEIDLAAGEVRIGAGASVEPLVG